MKHKAKLICLTGIDGTGKTTQAELLVSRCQEAGLRAVNIWVRWEPLLLKPLMQVYMAKHRVATPAGDDFDKGLAAKRGLLSRPLVRWLWTRASFLDYWVTKRFRVWRAMCRHDVVICDRYVFDFAIDQAMGTGASPDIMIRDIAKRLFRYFPKPDQTIVLQLDANTAVARKADGTSAAYVHARMPYYDALCKMDDVSRLDAAPPPESVHDAIWNHVHTALISRRS